MRQSAEPAAVHDLQDGWPSTTVEDDAFLPVVVYDEEPELFYASDEEGFEDHLELPVDPEKLAVPRRIIYLQGGLLLAVAIFSFSLGVLLGRSTSPPVAIDDGLPRPCQILGKVGVDDGAGGWAADIGAVVIVVPQGVRPEEKVEVDGLRPQDPPPDSDHPGLRAIEDIGGDYCRADEQGQFTLQLPDTGDYFLLTISSRPSRVDQPQAKKELAEMGRFFRLTPDLFAGHAHRWQAESVLRDRELNIVLR